MPTTAKVICDSISESGQRITTLVLEYPRIIHSEFMTHRMFSRNASSSRAIPVEKQIERIKDDPFVPKEWGSNKRGMQAGEQISSFGQDAANSKWRESMGATIYYVEQLLSWNVHKQLANRLLEPFSHIQVVVTATEWEGFFAQRLHPAAQPEIQELAKVMKEAMDASTPKLLNSNEWHLPFIEYYKDWEAVFQIVPNTNGNNVANTLIKVSVARCARVSYGLNERGWGDIEKDLALYDMLATSGHWSPFEHQATPMKYAYGYSGGDEKVGLPPDGYVFMDTPGITHMDRNEQLWSGNFKGWVQNRQLIQQ